AVQLSERNGAAERDDRRGAKRVQRLVQAADASEVCRREGWCEAVLGGDRCLEMQGGRIVTRLGRALQERDSLADQSAVPQRTILFVERHQGAARVEP